MIILAIIAILAAIIVPIVVGPGSATHRVILPGNGTHYGTLVSSENGCVTLRDSSGHSRRFCGTYILEVLPK